MKLRIAIPAALILAFASAGVRAGDPSRGAKVYERCAGCHSLDANRVGPKHRGVFGMRAGWVAGFDYSTALKGSKIVWNEKTLDAWLSDPGGFIPGSRMGYRLSKARDRRDVIAYLRKQSRK